MSICAVGAVINVDAADFLYKAALPWWLAGLLGAGIGSVWNYAVSSALVWRRKRAAV
jgi:dolichol-phosphate mannosyltransferase